METIVSLLYTAFLELLGGGKKATLKRRRRREMKYDYYVICPVRISSAAQRERTLQWVRSHEAIGKKVYLPFRDCRQDIPISQICRSQFFAMWNSRAVAVFWDENSKGSHFDLGMAYALGKPIIFVHSFTPDKEEGSYLKVIKGKDGFCGR